MIEAVCEYIQTTNGKWRQGEHRNYPHERGREHRVLLVIKTFLPPLETLSWVTQRQCPPCQTRYLHGESKTDALVSPKAGRVLVGFVPEKHRPEATFGIELESRFLEGLIYIYMG